MGCQRFVLVPSASCAISSTPLYLAFLKKKLQHRSCGKHMVALPDNARHAGHLADPTALPIPEGFNLAVSAAAQFADGARRVRREAGSSR